MLVEYYIDALLVDPDAADAVWDAWHAESVTDDCARRAWTAIFWGETLHLL